MEIAGEVKVHILHRNDLRISAAGGAALHAETGAKRGFADADRCLFADAVEAVAEADGRCRLAFAGRRRIDRGHEDQLAVGAAGDACDELGRDLRLVMAVGQKTV